MPRRFSRILPPAAMRAIRRLAAAGRLATQPAACMRATTCSMWRSASRSSTSSRSRAVATASWVRSSGVGPIPPETITLFTDGSAMPLRTASAMSSTVSPTTSMRHTG